MNKRAWAGEAVLMIYRIIILSLVALVVLGVSVTFYDYNPDVRDSEALIIARDALNCLAPNGIVEGNSFLTEKNSFMTSCGYSTSERYYVRADVFEGKVADGEKAFVSYKFGDSGLTWIKKLFETNEAATEAISKYEVGFFEGVYPIEFVGDKNFEGELKVQVYVRSENE